MGDAMYRGTLVYAIFGLIICCQISGLTSAEEEEAEVAESRYFLDNKPPSQPRDAEDSWRPIVGSGGSKPASSSSDVSFDLQPGGHPVFSKLLEHHESRNIETYDTSLHNKFYNNLKQLHEAENRHVPFR
uniref:Uncharacterized protein n=1 Tax=Cacopsylla melanoneura TaxID=428564 RepID=A0A8D8R5F1_9HEMI